MAEPIVKQKSKDHRRRKNGRSAELWAERKRAANAARGKQRWVPGRSVIDTNENGTGLIDVPGYWTREAA